MDDENGVVDDNSGEDDKAEDGEDVHVLHRHVGVGEARLVDEVKTEQTSDRGERNGEDDDERVGPALEKNDHEEVNDKKSEE